MKKVRIYGLNYLMAGVAGVEPTSAVLETPKKVSISP